MGYCCNLTDNYCILWIPEQILIYNMFSFVKHQREWFMNYMSNNFDFIQGHFSCQSRRGLSMPVDNCLRAPYDAQALPSSNMDVSLFEGKGAAPSPHSWVKGLYQRRIDSRGICLVLTWPAVPLYWRRKSFQCGSLSVVPLLLLHRHFTGLGDAGFACLKQPFHVPARECAWHSPCGTGLTTQQAATTFFQVTGKLEHPCLVLHHFCLQTWLLWIEFGATDVPQSVGSSRKHWVYTLSC